MLFRKYFSAFFLVFVFSTATYSQVNFYETKFNGGVTCAGYSPGTSFTANGVFQIHIAPGSTIHKAYLLCGELGDGDTANFLFDGNAISFKHGVTQASPTFLNPNYGGIAAVHALDITSLIIPTDTSYTFTGTQIYSTQNFYTDFYLYVAYQNPSMPKLNSAIFLNKQDMAGTVYHSLKLQSMFPSTGDIGLGFHMGYMCSSFDGEEVLVNGNFLGIGYGPDANNIPGSCGGPVASFYFENKILKGLNDDDENLAINGPDVLSNITSIVAPASDSLYIEYNHFSNPTVDNSIWSVIVNYSEAVEMNNFCFGDTTLFLANDSAGYFAFQWEFDDPLSGPDNLSNYANTSHIFTAPGNYNVSLIRGFMNPPYSDTSIFSITIHPIPTVWLGSDTTLCNGQNLLLNPGIFNSYLWNTGDSTNTFNISTPGIYSVMVENFGCYASDSIVVSYTSCSNLVVANLSCSDTLFCEKNCIDFFDLSTNNPTSWQWFFPGADSTTSSIQNPTGICYNSYGSFDVTLIACNNLGCDTLTFTNFINCFLNPVDSIWSSNDTLFSLPAYSYQWFEVTSGLISGATNQYYVPTQLGGYFCLVTDSIGCEATSNTIALTLSPPTPEGEMLSVSPNPNDGNFQLEFGSNFSFNTKEALCQITDAIGRIVFISQLETPNSKLSLQLTNGIYFVEIKTAKMLYKTKIIIQH